MGLKITCHQCNRSFESKHDYVIHGGFGNTGHAYCDKDSTLLTFSSYDPIYVSVIESKQPWILSDEEREKVESKFIDCPCGGKFSFRNKPKCPSCGADLSWLFQMDVQYIAITDHIDGERGDKVWKD